MPEFNKIYLPKRILIAPLDWGLGHATRCVPIIHELLASHCEVLIGAEGNIRSLLQKEFPELTFLPLKGYRVKYGSTRYLTVLRILFQIPSILYSMIREHWWLKKTIKQHRIDAVISDNRFGLFAKNIPCVYITHQLVIKTGNRFTEKILQHFHRLLINRFSNCWVPDFSSGNNIAGELSHPSVIPSNAKYIGCLSRLEKRQTQKKQDLLIIISGPEPQRTLFENILLEQMKQCDKKILFVRGVPGNSQSIQSENISHAIVNHLSADILSEVIQQSNIVISRSGYTTVMDLIKLHQKAVLVPTPGQTEQEYLADYLHQKKIFFSVPQQHFSLNKALAEADRFNFSIPEPDMELYKKTVRGFVESL